MPLGDLADVLVVLPFLPLPSQPSHDVETLWAQNKRQEEGEPEDDHEREHDQIVTGLATVVTVSDSAYGKGCCKDESGGKIRQQEPHPPFHRLSNR